MSWRIIHISNESRLSLQANSLTLNQSGKTYKLPLEDIGVLIIENRGVVITSALLSACVAHKISVFICDEKYMPNGILLAYQQHSRQVAVIKNQLNWSAPFRKRLWQKITTQKINNQLSIFKEISQASSAKLEIYARSVQSGDTTNREGVAAREYFQNILPTPVVRSCDDRINAALNYGYAIIRGAIARTLASYGFLASVGIHHDSELNNFNLADDLIEPFRPCIDSYIFNNITNVGVLTKEDRIALINLLTQPVIIAGNECTLLRSVEVVVQSLVTATSQKEPDSLLLPVI